MVLSFYRNLTDENYKSINEAVKKLTTADIRKVYVCFMIFLEKQLLMLLKHRKDVIKFYEREVMTLNN